MKIKLVRHSGIPLIQQIHQVIADRISSGLLEEGSPLPSLRQLTKDLQVSLMTVVSAYESLEQAGYIERIQGKGSYVRKRKQQPDTKNQPKSGSRTWQVTIPDYLPRAQYWRYQQTLPPNQGIQFSMASIHPSLLPHQELTKRIQQELTKDPTLITQYGPFQGDIPFRVAAASYVKNLGLTLSPEEILVTNGTQQGIDLLARCFVGPEDVVVTEAPTYPAAIDVFRGRGARIVSIPVDEEGMRVDMLANLCDTTPPRIIYTIPSFQNPTGIVMSQRRRHQLLELARSYHCLILEDDPWSEIVLDGKSPLPIKHFDKDGHVIYIKGFSKILAPGCRIGIVAASGTVLNRLIAAKVTADLGSPLLTQRVLASFLASKQMTLHLKDINAMLRKRRDLTIDLLHKHAPEGVSWTVPKGGLTMWLTLPSWMNTEELLLEAQRHSITFMPGSACFSGEPEYNHIRISISNVVDEQLQQGIITLCDLLSSSFTRLTQGKMPVI